MNAMDLKIKKQMEDRMVKKAAERSVVEVVEQIGTELAFQLTQLTEMAPILSKQLNDMQSVFNQARHTKAIDTKIQCLQIASNYIASRPKGGNLLFEAKKIYSWVSMGDESVREYTGDDD